MNNKGQVTVFIIIGLIVVVIAGLLLYVNSMQRDDQQLVDTLELPLEIQPIHNYVSTCIKDTATRGLYLLAIQGGYINLPSEYLSADYSDVGYSYYYEGSSLVTKEEMESQLEQFINENVPECVDFSIFSEYEITNSEIEANVDILPNNVIFDLDYPITAKQGDKVTELSLFREEIPLRLGYLHTILASIVDKTLDDPDWIDLTYLSSFDLKIDVLPYNESVLVYSIKDESEAEPFIFLSSFAFKDNDAPEITIPDRIEWLDGLPFIFQVNVVDPDGDLFTCRDDTALFDISEDCMITFTPEVPGEYNVTITAEDVRGNVAVKDVLFVIKED